MAAGTLPAPGTKYGPCDTPCKHTDCALTIQMAACICALCVEPIGYDAAFYRRGPTPADVDVLTDTNGERYALVHAACVSFREATKGVEAAFNEAMPSGKSVHLALTNVGT